MRVLFWSLGIVAMLALTIPNMAARFGLVTPPWQHTPPVAVPPVTAPREPDAPPPGLTAMVSGERKPLSLPALQAYGATGTDALCAQASTAPDVGSKTSTAVACVRPAVTAAGPDASREILLAASTSLAQAQGRPVDDRDALIRDANGLILLGLRSGPLEAAAGLLPASAYDELARQSRDGRLHDIAAELWLANAQLCPAATPTCQTDAEEDAGRSLINAGRWFNDPARLQRAAVLLEGVLAKGKDALAPAALFYLQNHIGNAYSYASGFAPAPERIPLIQRAIAAYEPALAHADAVSPSFRSAMLWQNLGAALVDRGRILRDKADFERGIGFYERSLPLFNRQTHRQSWARAKSNMGAARGEVASAGQDLPLHDAALKDFAEAITAFDEGEERLDAAHTRYRLAQALAAKAGTATRLSRQRPVTEIDARASLDAVAGEARLQALKQLAQAAEVFRQAGSEDYLARVERLTGEIRRAL